MTDNIQRYKSETFTGTVKSLKMLVENLKLKTEDYHYDIKNNQLYVPKLGLRYQSGDCYIFPISNEGK